MGCSQHTFNQVESGFYSGDRSVFTFFPMSNGLYKDCKLGLPLHTKSNSISCIVLPSLKMMLLPHGKNLEIFTEGGDVATNSAWYSFQCYLPTGEQPGCGQDNFIFSVSALLHLGAKRWLWMLMKSD
ncbi:laminin subunit beta-1-like [Oncorhynchus tshawytscha]|uniref:laminin subunit beta-1-like n=1 Tax=Oncorhynchus tshawytscha TaxID=74940 RepID=UPI001C3D52DB|nr:laminin subunit beta-1-like [Oncorhynchus tshawytscha]